MWKLSSQFLIGIEQRPVGKLLQDPGPVPSLPRKRCADPVAHGCWHNTNRLGRLGFFSKDQEGVGALAFVRIPGPCSRGWNSVPTKSSTVWLIPQTLAFLFREVRKS